LRKELGKSRGVEIDERGMKPMADGGLRKGFRRTGLILKKRVK
jgi:hypothetical protein